MKQMVRIFTDSGSDNINDLQSGGVEIVSLYISFDSKSYLKMSDISLEEFYSKMRNCEELPKTSSASIEDYTSKFEKCLKNNEDVLYISMNSSYSSTHQSAVLAAEVLRENYPNRRIEIIDSKNVCYGQYYLTQKANELAQQNKNIDDIILELNPLIENIKYFFTVESLEYLHKGGRIGKASTLIGGVLNIKPILTFENGSISPVGKVNGRLKSIKSLVEKTKDFFNTNDISNYHIAILNADCNEEKILLKETLENELQFQDIPIFNLGIALGLHAGPGTIGIALIKIK